MQMFAGYSITKFAVWTRNYYNNRVRLINGVRKRKYPYLFPNAEAIWPAPEYNEQTDGPIGPWREKYCKNRQLIS